MWKLKLLFLFNWLLAVEAGGGDTPPPPPPPPLWNHTRDSYYWYAMVDHYGPYRGIAPWLNNPEVYPIYTIMSEDISGDQIQEAISLPGIINHRHSMERYGWLVSQPRVVYFPPGIYYINETLMLKPDTVLLGDPTNPPTLKAAPDFEGDIFMNGLDMATGLAAELSGELTPTVTLKNLIIDTTEVNADRSLTVLWWQVSQASHFSNVKIRMAPSRNGTLGHTGILLGPGATLCVADVRLEKGLIGISHYYHRQTLYKNIHFYKNVVGMSITEGRSITLLAPTFEGVTLCVNHTVGTTFVGLIDATSINSGLTFNSSAEPSVFIENLIKDNETPIVELPVGVVLGPAKHVNNWSYGNTVGANPIYSPTVSSATRPESVAPGGRIPIFSPPNYAFNPVTDFVNIKDPRQNGGHVIKADGFTDNADALNKVLQYAVDNDKIAYFPHGDYHVSSTLYIPVGSRIIGEAWPTISGSGYWFTFTKAPRPVVQVGRPGDVGTVHIQDMRFTVSDVSPGAIILQFHVAGTKPGDVAMWNSLVTLGGIQGSTELLRFCSDAENQCKAVLLGIHLAKGSSVYFENIWNWVADHEAEDFIGGLSMAGKGGMLIETTNGTWLHALASEHWWLYQINLREAENVVFSMLQTETHFEQGNRTLQVVPSPWAPDAKTWGDPDFTWCHPEDKTCRMGFPNYINGGSNLYFYGSAQWTRWAGPTKKRCVDHIFGCQDYATWIAKTPRNLNIYGMGEKGCRVALRLEDGSEITGENGFNGTWGAIIGRYTPEDDAPPEQDALLQLSQS